MSQQEAVQIVKEQAEMAEREYVGMQKLSVDLKRGQRLPVVLYVRVRGTACDHGVSLLKDCNECDPR